MATTARKFKSTAPHAARGPIGAPFQCLKWCIKHHSGASTPYLPTIAVRTPHDAPKIAQKPKQSDEATTTRPWSFCPYPMYECWSVTSPRPPACAERRIWPPMAVLAAAPKRICTNRCPFLFQPLGHRPNAPAPFFSVLTRRDQNHESESLERKKTAFTVCRYIANAFPACPATRVARLPPLRGRNDRDPTLQHVPIAVPIASAPRAWKTGPAGMEYRFEHHTAMHIPHLQHLGRGRAQVSL